MPTKDFILDFVIEEGHSNEGAPAEIVSLLKRKKIPEVSEFLGTVLLGEKKKVPGLQAADGLAFGAWHMESTKNYSLVDVAPDATVKALRAKTIMRIPTFRCHIDERELKIFKRGYFTHINLRRLRGALKHAGAKK